MRAKVWFPQAAQEWLVGDANRILSVGGTRMLPALLARAGHEVFWVHPDAKTRHPGISIVTATAENLPFDPMLFDAVMMHDWLHKVNADLALPQISRVLRPNGTLSASALCRDDSVPWVRRLIGLLRKFDPLAMPGDYGTAAIDKVRRSKYFNSVATRSFRIWHPISRKELIELVLGQGFIASLSQAVVDDLVADVGKLYDDSARPAEDLMLPFQLLCWRAQVSHSENTTPINRPEPGLRIQL